MSRKFLVTAILILFLLPFVSWYYLQSGLKWRKEAQALMSGTQLFPAGQWTDIGGTPFKQDHLKDHVTLVARSACATASDVSILLDQLYDQFKETKKANFFLLDECADTPMKDDSLRLNWFVFHCSDSLPPCTELLVNWPEGKSFALVDRDKTIRSYYAASTKDEKRLLLEHMALLLPRERSEKVELKRGAGK